MATVLTAGVARAATIVACVGDSITAGTWPSDLGTDLGSAYTVNNYGVSGTTLLKNGSSPYWNTQQFTDSQSAMPDIVVIMLGTNDSMPQNWGTYSGQFAGDYEAMVDTYAALASKPRIFLNLPPPASDNNMFSISGTTIKNEILPLIRQTAAKKGVGLIDVWDAFGGDNADSSLYIGDGVHPSATGAQLIADTVFAAITAPPDAGTGSTDAGSTDAASTPDAAAVSSDAAGGTGDSAPGSGDATGAAGSGGASGVPDSGSAPGASGSGGASGAPGSGGASGAPDSGGGLGSKALPDSGGSSSTTGAGGAGSSGAASNPPSNQSGCSSSLAIVPVAQGAAWSIALIVAVALRRRRTWC
jgi:acyl-CoA thioesterase-1